MQQWWYLKKSGVAKPNPWQQFLKDMKTYAEDLQDKGHGIVLALDTNEDLLEEGAFKTVCKGDRFS
eukprot:2441527-Ditylum_brightwellii.AAC.2